MKVTLRRALGGENNWLIANQQLRALGVKEKVIADVAFKFGYLNAGPKGRLTPSNEALEEALAHKQIGVEWK